MKPSERIYQLMIAEREQWKQEGFPLLDDTKMRPMSLTDFRSTAIARYLDEQHEAQAVQRDPVQNAELIDGGLYVRARAVQGAAETLRNLLDHWGQMTPERAKKGIETALSELTGDTK